MVKKVFGQAPVPSLEVRKRQHPLKTDIGSVEEKRKAPTFSSQKWMDSMSSVTTTLRRRNGLSAVTEPHGSQPVRNPFEGTASLSWTGILSHMISSRCLITEKVLHLKCVILCVVVKNVEKNECHPFSIGGIAQRGKAFSSGRKSLSLSISRHHFGRASDEQSSIQRGREKTERAVTRCTGFRNKRPPFVEKGGSA